jgi:hypothetical protein
VTATLDKTVNYKPEVETRNLNHLLVFMYIQEDLVFKTFNLTAKSIHVKCTITLNIYVELKLGSALLQEHIEIFQMGE